ncbi:hypothetical protein BDW74DRAFT_177934 [Aspergillus multicolor]|uniref:uncharacterized protein n=1 Tax=Aspergillus multicolor TaxID=41759 RepID=UPI003CCDD32E
MELCFLPNEILILIAESREERNDCLSLARCCRLFYETLMPLAFTKIELQSNCQYVLSILVHMLYGTIAMLKVWSLNLKLRWCDHPSKPRFKRKLMLEAIRRLTKSEYNIESWENYLREKPDTSGWGPTDGWKALLLTLVPNLEVLSIEGEFISTLRRQVVTKVSRRQRPFATVLALGRLREVSLEAGLSVASGASFLEDDIIPFLSLPTMCELSCRCFYDSGEYGEEQIPTKCDIDDLAFWDCNSQTGFRSIVHACKKTEEILLSS